MNHVRLKPFHDASQTPSRRQVHFRLRRDGNQLQSFGNPSLELTVRMRHERGPVANRSQAVDSQQDLILPAAPRSSCVYVE